MGVLVGKCQWNPWVLCGGNQVVVPLKKGSIVICRVSDNNANVIGVEELGWISN
jgi:hypothetical protein